MVDARIEAQLVDDVIALGLAAGDAHGAAAVDFRELAHDAADGAGRRGDEHGFAGLGSPDLEEAKPRGQPRHAEDAEIVRRRYAPRVDRGHVGGFRDAMALPAELRQHLFADFDGRITGADDLANGLAHHDLVELRRRHV